MTVTNVEIGPPFHIPAMSRREETRTFDALSRRWKLILTCGIIGAIIVIVVSQFLPPRYTSMATLMLDPLTQQYVSAGRNQISSFIPPSEEMVRKNEMAFIRSRLLADQVITEMDLVRDPEFNLSLQKPSKLRAAITQAKTLVAQELTELGFATTPPSPTALSERDQVIDIFLRHLDVSGPDATRIIDIRLSSANPEKAARLAQAVADRTLHQMTSDMTVQAKIVLKSLEKDIAAVNERIFDAEKKIEIIRRSQNDPSSTNVRNLEERISEISKQIAGASSERAAAEGRLNEFRAAQASGRIETLPAVLSSLLIQRLQAEAAEIAAKIAGQATSFGSTNRKLDEARATLASLHGQISQEVARIATNYQSGLSAAKTKEAALLASLENLKEQLATARTADINVRLYERQADISRTLLSQLITRLSDTQAQMDTSPVSGQIISNATVPRLPSFPSTVPLAALGFVVSATGCALLVTITNSRNATIRSVAQLRCMTDARILGTIPAISNWHALRRRSPAVCVLTEPQSAFADSLRAVWLQIERGRQELPRTVLITSSVANEGKSAIAASLARMLAIGGRSVALVDADLREPQVHSMLAIPKLPGLSDLLAGSVSLNDVLVRDKGSSAWIVPAGDIASNSPLALLSSTAMSQALTQLASRFDVVIVDSPPLLVVPDAGVLAQLCETTVMAVRWGETNSDAFGVALGLLRDHDVNLQGVVLTMVKQQNSVHYGYLAGG